MAEEKNTKQKFNELYGPYELAEAVKEKPYDSDLVGTLDAIIARDYPGIASLAGLPADQAHVLTKGFSKDYKDKLLAYVRTDLGNLVSDVVNKENAIPLVFGFKSYVNNAQGKLVKEIQRDMELLEKAEKDPQVMDAIAKELMGWYPDNLKEAIAYIAGSDNNTWVMNTYQGLIAVKQNRLVSNFANKEGKLDLGKIKGYIGANLMATPNKEKEETYAGFANVVANTYKGQAIQEAQEQAAQEQAA